MYLESTLKKASNGAISKINSLLPPIRIESNLLCMIWLSLNCKKRFSIENNFDLSFIWLLVSKILLYLLLL